MIALKNSKEFYEALVIKMQKQQERLDCVDFALETTNAVFIIDEGGTTVTYRHDFSYYFGLQIAALKRLRETDGEEDLLSPFGDRIRISLSRVEISNSKLRLVVASGENGIQSYFNNMVPILREVQEFLEERRFVSENISEFIADIRGLFQG